jgi:hypothetical protein
VSNYVSSMTSKYGDTAKVKEDSKVIFSILDRQGADLIIDALAEYTATSANKFNLSPSDRSMTMIALVDSLEASLKERL